MILYSRAAWHSDSGEFCTNDVQFTFGFGLNFLWFKPRIPVRLCVCVKGKEGGGVLALGKLYDHSLCFLWCRRV